MSKQVCTLKVDSKKDKFQVSGTPDNMVSTLAIQLLSHVAKGIGNKPRYAEALAQSTVNRATEWGESIATLPGIRVLVTVRESAS